MGLRKLNDLLFKVVKTPIRLADATTSTYGPAGVKSKFHSNSQPAKYSAVALALDAIFVDKVVVGYNTKDSVYTKFMEDGLTYECCIDETGISWVGKEPRKQHMMLIPVVLYVVSDVYNTDASTELKEYFLNIKNNEDVKQAVILFCDAFYYGFMAEDGHPTITSNPNELTPAMISRSMETGIFKPMSIMSGIETTITEATPSAATEEEEEEAEKSYIVEYDGWTEEEKLKITGQKYLDTYVVVRQTESIANKIKFRMDRVIAKINSGIEGIEAIGNDYINVLLVGRPGTGKTALMHAISAMTGMPIYTIPFSKNTEEDTVEGKNKVIDGKIGFVETDFLKAYQNGGIIVCEEINLADPAVVMGCMGQAIEYPFIVMKDGYEPIRRHPLCIIIGTMNSGTAGSKQLNQALSSRFKSTYILDDPDKNTFVKILAAKGHPKKLCRYVYTAYERITNYLKDPQQSQEELCENITMRGCFGALEGIEEGEDPKTAINNTLVGKIAEVDLETARKVRDNVVDALAEYR